MCPQLAVETLLGLKNSQGSKGEAPTEEESAQAMAAVTAAASAAAAAAAQESEARATMGGVENDSAASAAAAAVAAAATAKAVADAVAAAGGIPPPPSVPSTDGGTLNLPLVGEGKDTTDTVVPVPAAESIPPAAAAAAATTNGVTANMPLTDTVIVDEGPTQGLAEAEAKEVPKDDGAPGDDAQQVLLPTAAAASQDVAPSVSAHRWAPLHGGPEEASAGGRAESATAPVESTEQVNVEVEDLVETEPIAAPDEARLPTAEGGMNEVSNMVMAASEAVDGKQRSVDVGLDAEPVPAPANVTAESGVDPAPRQAPRTIVSSV